MATYYWVGGAGTWSGTGNTQFAVTSGGVPTALNPTSADTVNFDANSGTAATVTVTATAVSLSTTINKSDVNLSLSGSPTLCTAVGTCTLTAGTITLNSFTLTTGLFSSSNSNTRAIAFGTGNITLTGSGTTIWTTGTATGFSFTGTPTINCTYSGSTGTRTFQLGSVAGGTEANSINLNITAGTDGVTIGSSSKVKNLNLTGWAGALNSPNTTYYGSLTKSSGMTDVSAVGTSIFAATSGTNTITSNGVAFACNVTFNGIGGTWVCADALSTGANALTLTNGKLKLAAGTTSTVGSFVTSGTNPKYLLSSTPGTTATISDASGTNTVTYLTIQDSVATGGASWYATSQTNVDAGDNTGWSFGTTPSLVTEITMRLRSFTQPRRF